MIKGPHCLVGIANGCSLQHRSVGDVISGQDLNRFIAS
jgi:hypothetical protein